MFENRSQFRTTDSGPFTDTQTGTSLTIRHLAANEPITGGNKHFKLRYNLLKAKELGFNKLVTFGGVFSNHIAATARAGKQSVFETAGIIRGEKAALINSTLTRAAADGMQLIFVSREDYRKKNEPGFLAELLPGFENYYPLPEGGANADGVKGCMEIISAEDEQYDYITVCCGTGTTAAGIILSMKPHQQMIGFSVLRDKGFMEQEIEKWINEFKPSQRLPLWEVNHDFDFGGYAKSTPELIKFCHDFQLETKVAIEPVYTGKMFWGLQQLVAGGYFKPQSKILAIHTGGMQYLL